MGKLQLLLVIYLCFIDIVINYQTQYEFKTLSDYNTNKKREKRQQDTIELQLPVVKHNLTITNNNKLPKDHTENTRTVKVESTSKEDRRKNESSLISTSDGLLQGVIVNEKNIKYYSFRGIPYAEKPIRFQASKPIKPWKGIRNATKYPEECYQKNGLFNIIGGSEDCLFLNINTPTVEDKKLPVIVWIYGGAFKFGTADLRTYDPIRFLKKDIIIASIYYRVGALGFLSTRTEHAPGNVGLKDIVLGLRWIKKNIHMFGGDTNNICLYGVSSGGSAVEYLTLSQMSRGLFHKAISQSGTTMSTLMYTSTPIQTAFKLGTYFGYYDKDLDELMEVLQKANASSIVEANFKMDEASDNFLTLNFVPSCEEKLTGEIFLDDHPENILKSGNYNHVPYIIGYNNKEGISLITFPKNLTNFLKSANNLFEYIQPKDLFDGVKYHKRKDILTMIKNYYFGDRPITMDTIEGVIDILGDVAFAYGVHKSIDIRAKNSKYPLYYFEFAFHEETSLIYIHNDINITGAAHGEDIAYVFNVIKSYWNEKSTLASQRIVQIYVNFAKYGNPTPNQTELLPVLWPPVKNDSFPYLRLSNKIEIKRNGNRDRFEFWSKIYADRYQ